MTDTTTQTNTILDLRPPKNSIITQLLRLGLTYDHEDATGETWTDYKRGIKATFTNRQATDVTLTDMDTKNTQTTTTTALADVTEIKTWRSDGAGD